MEEPDLSLVSTNALSTELIKRFDVSIFIALPLGEDYDWRLNYSDSPLHALLGLLEVAKAIIVEGRISKELSDEEEVEPPELGDEE